MSDSIGNRKELPDAPDDLVRRAVLQVRAYSGDVDQSGARRALPHWQHFAELTAGEMLAVVDAFPADEDCDAPRANAGHWVDTGSGPGYLA